MENLADVPLFRDAGQDPARGVGTQGDWVGACSGDLQEDDVNETLFVCTNQCGASFRGPAGSQTLKDAGWWSDGRGVVLCQSCRSLAALESRRTATPSGYWRKLPCPDHGNQFHLECPACNAKNSEWVGTALDFIRACAEAGNEAAEKLPFNQYEGIAQMMEKYAAQTRSRK